MSSRFPLLRLPRLVLFEVFKALSIDEKIKLSLCSKKISTQINNARLYSQKVIVALDLLYKEINVYSENKKDTLEISIHPDPRKTLNSSTRQFFTACYTKGITIFWENHRDGYLSVIRHMSKMFQCKFSISKNFNSDIYQPVVSELFDLQQEFKTFTIDLNVLKDLKLWDHISTKFGLVEYLKISSFVNSDFKLVITSWPQEIIIMRSDWITLDSLLTCTCTKITLGELGNKDFDEILKKWKTGGFPKLKQLKIYSMRITNNVEHILGMNFWELSKKVIQTNDGSKKATINTGYGRVEMSVTPAE
ncbi:hypothetical protein GCK72_003124 [Caenorhabditis remanei]|uniref:F-box domain-containing protein n=1 Tax=Caenorhabditis remanei TaxID=31234 RepID=A0A6A5HTM3_CAERE|nr:hypothetical protein GCK72_003124 [Caenorhabditis remanei]KAF1771298.1 hypothetical protein GCK72_003124 [Caenorhabditis remanei]